MTGLDEFNQFFGDITLGTLLKFGLAVFFILYVCKHVKAYLLEKQKLELQKAEIEQKRDKDLAEALEGVRKYPEYRQQSIEIQHKLEDENCEVRKDIQEFKTEFGAAMTDLAERVKKMEEDTKRRERNKIRNTLMQNYRYYTNPETNPTHSWTRTERDTFWSLFKEYEENGGDGDMHTIVQPAMERLIIVENETHITSK